MKISRRDALKIGSIGVASAAGAAFGLPADGQSASAGRTAATAQTSTKPCDEEKLPSAFAELKPLGKRVKPISDEEFWGRIVLAQRLMSDAKPQYAALYVTPGTSLYYYTGIRWWPSERLLALLIPRVGDPTIVCPAFEEGRLRELLRWPIPVRVWEEDASPYAIAGQWLEERRSRTGRVGVEETTRFAFLDGVRRTTRTIDYVSGDPITVGCRGQKTSHELELMKLACEATCDVYRAVFASLYPGITDRQVSEMISRGYQQMEVRGDALVLFGKYAAQPHGTKQPEILREGDIVLIDGGTTVEGYQSDITRCTVLGTPPDKLKRAFDLVRKAQDAALITLATEGTTCGAVDDAARAVIIAGGYGPGYKYFTHRVGHGIGLDGHEQPYLVHGNKVALQPGMTFSNEPGIYVPGDFGLRLEDDMVVSETGGADLLTPGFSPSLEKPVA
jgi:Xaa-Pro dipeptidase